MTIASQCTGGTKSPVSVSDEKVQANQDHLFLAFVLISYHKKNSLFTLDIHIFEMLSIFESVILLKIIQFYKKFVV